MGAFALPSPPADGPPAFCGYRSLSEVLRWSRFECRAVYSYFKGRRCVCHVSADAAARFRSQETGHDLWRAEIDAYTARRDGVRSPVCRSRPHHAPRPTGCPAPQPAQTHSRSRAEPHVPTSRATCNGPPRGHGHTLGRSALTSRPFTRNSVVGSDTNIHTARHSGQVHSDATTGNMPDPSHDDFAARNRQRSHVDHAWASRASQALQVSRADVSATTCCRPPHWKPPANYAVEVRHEPGPQGFAHDLSDPTPTRRP